MQFKPIFLVLFVAVLLATQSDAHLKLKLLKAKLLAAKAPHVIAHLAVAKDVKIKTATAWVKGIEAVSDFCKKKFPNNILNLPLWLQIQIKAVNKATFTLATAPFRVAKKTFALKVAGLKAAKALKIAKAIAIVKTLKKHPIIVPVPVPVKVPFPVFGKHDGLKGAAAAGLTAAGITGAASGLLKPVTGLISGAQDFITKSAGW